MRWLLLFILLTTILFSFEECRLPSENTPIISSISAEPDSVYPGDTVFLSFTSSNLHQADHFDWSCPVGSWVTKNNLPYGTTQWIAPKIIGEHDIRLSLFNGDHVTTDSIRVVILDTVGTFIDYRDNHIYQWVKIGKQFWMAENLAYLPQVSASTAAPDNSGHYYVYGYQGTSASAAKQTSNYKTYGVLYNEYTYNHACPDGWRRPGGEDWNALVDYLGPQAGRKLKSEHGWNPPQYPNGEDGNGDNSSGFNALPGGYYVYMYAHGGPFSKGVFVGMGDVARLWFFELNAYSVFHVTSGYEMGSAFYIRCIKMGDE